MGPPPLVPRVSTTKRLVTRHPAGVWWGVGSQAFAPRGRATSRRLTTALLLGGWGFGSSVGCGASSDPSVTCGSGTTRVGNRCVVAPASGGTAGEAASSGSGSGGSSGNLGGGGIGGSRGGEGPRGGDAGRGAGGSSGRGGVNGGGTGNEGAEGGDTNAGDAGAPEGAGLGGGEAAGSGGTAGDQPSAGIGGMGGVAGVALGGTAGASTGGAASGAGGNGGGNSGCSNSSPISLPIDEGRFVALACNDWGIQGTLSCFDDGVNPSGCVNGVVPFRAGEGVCLTGNTTQGNYEAWGAGIALSLNEPVGGPVAAYDAVEHDVVGFQVVITGITNGLPLRIAYNSGSGGISPFIQVPGEGTWNVLIAQALVPSAWPVPEAGTTPNPRELYYLEVTVVGAQIAADYDFCISAITPFS